MIDLIDFMYKRLKHHLILCCCCFKLSKSSCRKRKRRKRTLLKSQRRPKTVGRKFGNKDNFIHMEIIITPIVFIYFFISLVYSINRMQLQILHNQNVQMLKMCKQIHEKMQNTTIKIQDDDLES